MSQARHHADTPYMRPYRNMISCLFCVLRVHACMDLVCMRARSQFNPHHMHAEHVCVRMLTHDVDEQHAGSTAFFLQAIVSVALHWKERIVVHCGAHVQHALLGLIQT